MTDAPGTLPALFLDLDDTLYPCGPVYAEGVHRAWRRLAQEHPLDEAAFAAAYGAAREAVKRALPGSTSSHSRLLYFKRLLEDLTGRSRPRLALALDDASSSAWDRIDFAPARAVLEGLSGRYRLGLLTNQVCRTQLEKIARLDPEGTLFHWVVTSEEAGAEKPAPAIFREAARRAGCRPADLRMVGDDWEVDVQPVLALGGRAVWLSRDPWPRQDPRVRRAATLADLPVALAALEAGT